MISGLKINQLGEWRKTCTSSSQAYFENTTAGSSKRLIMEKSLLTLPAKVS